MTRKRDGSENRRVRERGGVKRERREREALERGARVSNIILNSGC